MSGEEVEWLSGGESDRNSDPPPFTMISAIKGAWNAFETAMNPLVCAREETHDALLNGVPIPTDLYPLYLGPPSLRQSIRALRVWYDRKRNCVSAVHPVDSGDGLVEAFLGDIQRERNEAAWRDGFRDLSKDGILLVLYNGNNDRRIARALAFAEILRKWEIMAISHGVHRPPDDINLASSGASVRKEKVSAFVRAFPPQMLFDIMKPIAWMAGHGATRLIPEWGHRTNCAWLAIFHENLAFFEEAIPSDMLITLKSIIPKAMLATPTPHDSNRSAQVSERAKSADCLTSIPDDQRGFYSLTTTGAHDPMYSLPCVIHGARTTREAWQRWIRMHARLGYPIMILPTLDRCEPWTVWTINDTVISVVREES